MADQNNLTDDEQKFFETGELPVSLTPDVTPDPVVTAPVDPTTQQPVSPANDALELLRQNLIEEQRRAADAEARLRIFEEQKAVKPVINAPDPETDPLGAMMHQLNQVNNTVTELQAKLLEQKQQADQQQQLLQFQSSIKAIRDDFVKTTPDFQQAYEHLRTVRIEDLKAVGVPENQIQQALMQDEIVIAQNALRSGKNPAETIYNLAKRHGYTPTAGGKNADQKLANIQAGSQSAKNVQSASPPAADITSEGLKNASDADLDAMVRDEKQWAKITGGAVGKDIFH